MSGDHSQDRAQPVTTTHDPAGGGRPRLIFSPESSDRLGVGDETGGQYQFDLLPGVSRIGSSPLADLRLTGLDDRHAEIRCDAGDEYIYVHLGHLATSTVNGARVEEKSLHTGDRLRLGDWTMSFYREEFADHGRPYGGREGGEFSHQRPQQPPRRRGTSPAGGHDRTETDPGEYL